jgi:gluconate 2-dehydrogenase subunit 3-like protein
MPMTKTFLMTTRSIVRSGCAPDDAYAGAVPADKMNTAGKRLIACSPIGHSTWNDPKRCIQRRPIGEGAMDAMERRVFLRGTSLGLLSFTLGGVETLMTPGEARARAVPFRMLNGAEAETIEALGETLVPGAREAGVAHFIDQQVSGPPGDALLEARIVNVKPPFINFYRAAINGVDKASTARSSKRFAALSAAEQHDFVDLLRQNKIEGWQGPPAGLVYFALRSDAVDVVYGTMEGYERLGVPYLPHIAPDRRW